ncbi:MAG: hypothetical protein JWO32_955, partial [Bacteroidetes bacterium]|nr:hypothetical protein [Bacteroidota bacterium]
RNNIICITGGYEKYINLDSISLPGSIEKQAFVAILSSNLNVQTVGYTSANAGYGGDGSASGSCCSIDLNGNIWVMLDSYHGLKWNVGPTDYTFSEGTTNGGQQLFKINSNLQYLWDKAIFMGIGPEVYEACILTDSNTAVIASRFSWGSGAGTHTSIRKFASDGSIGWTKSFDLGIEIVGMDNKFNIYTCTSENNFTLYKYTPDGTQIYANADTLWKHAIFEWDFTNEDEFYALGACTNNSNNCVVGEWFLTHYKVNSALGVIHRNDINQVSNVYPNPNNGLFSIKTSQEIKNGRIQVINSHGEVIYSQLLSEGKIFQFDLNHELKGIYFIKLDAENFKSFNKIINN